MLCVICNVFIRVTTAVVGEMFELMRPVYPLMVIVLCPGISDLQQIVVDVRFMRSQ